MYSKKGQVSIFLIIGAIIIISIISLTFFSTSNTTKDLETQKKENQEISSNNIKIFLDSCFESSYYKSLQNIGFHGGYFISNEEIPLNFNNDISTLNYKFPIYLLNNKTLIPSEQTIKNELGEGIVYFFTLCAQENEKITLNPNNAEFEINFYNSKIITNMDLPTIYNETNYQKTYSRFTYQDVTSNLLEYVEIAKIITQILQENIYSICISCLNELKENKDIDLTISEINDDKSVTYYYFISKKNNEHKDILVFGFTNVITKFQEGFKWE